MCVILVKTWMFTPFQAHISFTTENNGVNFHSSKISPTDSMLTGHNQELSMLSKI